MMKKSLLFIPFLALVLTGCNGGGGGSKKKSSTDTSAGPSKDDPEGFSYYTARYRNKKDCFGKKVDDYHLYDSYGDELADQIHDYLVDNHTTYLTYSGANYHNLFAECDKAVGKEGRITLFYTAKETTRGSGNREHVWPCANSADLWYRSSEFYEHQIDKHLYWGGGSDIFNLHACDGNVNEERGNSTFVIFPDTTGMPTFNDGGPYSLIMNNAGNKAQPDVHYRGNIARIVMYMWCHYSQRGSRNAYYPKNYASLKPVYNIEDAIPLANGHTPYMFSTSGLPFSKIMGQSTKEEIYATLKDWNEQDPPDEQEQHANDYVESSVQGNRNPFIDYPQLVDRVLDYLH